MLRQIGQEDSAMLVSVTTDNNIDGSDKLRSYVEELVGEVLGRFRDRITRVQVHLADENGRAKSGDKDKRCTIEARVSGLKPIAVSEQAASLDQAISAAAGTLEKSLNRTLGRLGDRKRHAPSAGDTPE
jgi:ribosomal subunit interface protein